MGRECRRRTTVASLQCNGTMRVTSPDPASQAHPSSALPFSRLDKEFTESRKKLEERLKADSAFTKWTYVVSKWTIDPLLKERKDLLAEKKEEPKKDEPATPGPVK